MGSMDDSVFFDLKSLSRGTTQDMPRKDWLTANFPESPWSVGAGLGSDADGDGPD